MSSLGGRARPRRPGRLSVRRLRGDRDQGWGLGVRVENGSAARRRDTGGADGRRLGERDRRSLDPRRPSSLPHQRALGWEDGGERGRRPTALPGCRDGRRLRADARHLGERSRQALPRRNERGRAHRDRDDRTHRRGLPRRRATASRPRRARALRFLRLPRRRALPRRGRARGERRPLGPGHPGRGELSLLLRARAVLRQLGRLGRSHREREPRRARVPGLGGRRGL